MIRINSLLCILLLVTLTILTGCMTSSTPKLVAHRGEEHYAPEGSIPAYQIAVKDGCDIMKMDVHETKDGVVVMSHDPGVGRTMGWNTNIIDVTYAELKEKGTFKPVGGYANEKIVTLREALAVSKPMPEFWIDFKRFTPEFCEKVLKEFADAGIDERRIMVATFTKKALVYMQKTHPAVRRVGHIGLTEAKDKSGWTTNAAPKRTFATKDEAVRAVLAYRDELGLFGVNMPVLQGQTTKEDIAFLRQNGLWVSLWFVNNTKMAEKYKACGADAYVTCDAAACRAVE